VHHICRIIHDDRLHRAGPRRDHRGSGSPRHRNVSLGEIITDDAGYTIYTFKMDEQDSGTSNCYDECATTWPAVEASDTSSPEGITGEIGSLTRTDGTTQLTVDGWPVYRFAKDTEPGQVNGQGVKDAWYVLQPDGTINMEAATEGAATPAS
jgi:predicted lipoprotein with Yx(FWY)xxD motif